MKYNRMFVSALTSIVAVLLVSSLAFAQTSDLCLYSLTPPNQAIGSAGTIGGPSKNVTVNTADGCEWMAVSNDDWIRIVFGADNTLGNYVTYAVSANPGPNARRGTMTIAGLTFIVSQASPLPAPCRITVTESETVSYKHWAGRRFAIMASTPTCSWEIQSKPLWITIRTAFSGLGSVLVTYDIEENPGPKRAGKIRVNGKDFTIIQLQHP